MPPTKHPWDPRRSSRMLTMPLIRDAAVWRPRQQDAPVRLLSELRDDREARAPVTAINSFNELTEDQNAGAR